MRAIPNLHKRDSNDHRNTLPAVYNELAISAYNPYLQPDLQDDQIDLRQIWRTISRYRLTIFLVILIFAVTTLIASLLTTPEYRASALIEVQPNQNVFKFQNIQSQEMNDREYLNTQINILLSESVANAVIQDMELSSDPEFNGELSQRGLAAGIGAVQKGLFSVIGTIKSLLGAAESDADNAAADGEIPPELIEQRELLKKYQDNLGIDQVPQSDLIRVSFVSFSPTKAADIANAHTRSYVELSDKRRFDSTSGAKTFLGLQIEEAQASLESAEQALTDFARARNIVDVEDRANYMETRLAELNGALTETRQDRITAEVEFRQAEVGDIASIPKVLEGELILSLRKDLAELQSEYKYKSSIFKETYPEMLSLKEKIDDIQSSLGQESQRLVDGLQNSYEQLISQEERLLEQVEKQQNEMLDLKDRAIQYNILKREWEADKELFVGLLEKQKDVRVATGMEINNLSIVDPAAIPVEKFRPKTLQNVAIAGVVGTIFGLGIAFLLAFMDNTFRNGDDLEASLGIPFLGMVPQIDVKLDSGVALHVASENDRLGQMAEAVRSIRTNILFSRPESVPKKILITSTTSGEGKSTLASNLALVMAQNGSRTLILEADLRRPNISRWLGIDDRPGLSDYLSGSTKQDIIKATQFENLYCIPAGTLHSNPSELLGSKVMDEYLETLSEYFDYLIFDGPPVLGLADSLVLSLKTEGAVVVVKSGEPSKDAVRETVKRLRTVNAPLIGSVLNCVDTSQKGYGYYQSYYYNYSDPERERLSNSSA